MLAVAGAAAATLPLSRCSSGPDTNRPDILYRMIGENKTIEIGKAYIKRFPLESDRHQLTALISTTLNEQPASLINVRIQNEFRNGKIVMINGWILSITEARQSALYYLNSLS